MKSIYPARRPRPEPHPLEATTVWKEYRKAKEEQRSKQARARRRRLALIALAIVVLVGIAATAVVLLPLRQGELTLPLDAKSRSAFVEAQGAKLSQEERMLLTRFLSRLQAQESAGGPAPKLTIAAAIERQRTYDQQVGEVQKRIRERLDAATGALGVNVREQAVVSSDPTQSTSGKSLRYTLELANRDKRTVDSAALRVEFRDASRKYVAAIPTLEIKGPILPRAMGRNVQMLPLDARVHQYILDGGTVQISAYPTQISYADGETIDAEKELKLLESLARARIE